MVVIQNPRDFDERSLPGFPVDSRIERLREGHGIS